MTGRTCTRRRIAAALLLAILAAVLFSSLAYAGPTAAPTSSGWLQDILDKVACYVAKTIQDVGRMLGVVLWDLLKLCGMVGLLGRDFATLFHDVIVEALNAVATGSLHAVIRGSLMVSLGLLGLSLLARPFWPDLRIVSFQRVVLWGAVIQAFLLNAGAIYTQLEQFRTGLAEEISGAVSSGAIPGCAGDTATSLLCVAGATEAEVRQSSLAALPDTLPPYGGGETIHDLYDHCVYNPAVYYGDAACDPDDPTGDPWQVLPYVQEGLSAQVLGLVFGGLLLCYGVLMIALGLSAGMMFVLFPVAGIFAFYQPLEAFPAGVIKNYITIFLKSIVLLTLAAIVIRLFSVASGSLISMAAVAMVALLLCFVMAKEALATLLSSVSFVGNSVGNIGANLGLTGGGGGGASLNYPSPESRMAAMMIGGGPVAQALMGAPNPYVHSLGGGGGGLIGAAGGGARAALQGTLGAASGGLGFIAGAVAAGGAAVSAVAASRQSGGEPPAPVQPAAAVSLGSLRSSLQASPPTAGPAARTAPRGSVLLPADPDSGAPPAVPALEAAASGGDLAAWTPASARQIQGVAARLQAAPQEVQDGAGDLIRAGHGLAGEWRDAGHPATLPDGTLDPGFVEETVQRAPVAAGAFALAQDGAPPDQRLGLDEVVALGVATERIIPAADAQRGFGRAVKTMGRGGSLDAALQREMGAGARAVFRGRAAQAELVAARMQQAGLGNDLGRQMVETVQDDLGRSPRLTAQQFREGGAGRLARMQAWDQATGDPETTDRIVDGLIELGPASNVAVREVARPPSSPAPTPAPAPPPEAAAAPAGHDEALFQQLRAWRQAAAQQAGKRNFHVFSDAALHEIAARRPQTLDELAAVKGVGPRKLLQYGAGVLAITQSTQEDGA